MKIKNLENKKIAILGYWVEWKSTERFLKKLNIVSYEILDKSINKDYLKNLKDFDIIFKSPWISPYNNPELLEVKDKLTSQWEILADNFKWKIIWITGTKGKSTISSLLYEILKDIWYKVKLVWNIWNPVLDEINIIPNVLNEKDQEEYDYIIYELSSYMLEGLELNLFIGLLNNIYDCHLDWHNWRGNYEIAKINVLKNAKYKLVSSELKSNKKLNKFENIDFFWLNWTYNYKKSSDEILEIKNWKFYIWNNLILDNLNISLKGEHNKKNIIWVFGVLDKIWIFKNDKNIDSIKKVLSEFTGLSHRQENIWKYNWITFINDAISVTQESTIAAIETFWKDIWTLFLGWVSTWVNYDKIRNSLIKYNIKNIVLFPDSWEEIFWNFSKDIEFDKEYILEWFWNYKPIIYKTKSMKNAVSFWFKNTKKAEYCILSSAAQSFSLWKWFIEKWDMFRKYVEEFEKN